MTSLQLIDQHFEPLTVTDTVGKAHAMLNQFGCNHLPVVEKEAYKGLLSKKDLITNENQNTLISELKDDFLPAGINGSAHFLAAVTIANLYRTDVIPVINETEEYMGSITHLDLITALGKFCGAGEYGALIVLEIEKSKLIFSELNTIMESNGAIILHYNVSPIAATEIMEVSIGIDVKEISTILATLNQYKYKVLFTSGVDLTHSELSDNYNNLMNYLAI